jgi:hypothetical protein
MERPRELFETELAEIREELRRLGIRPRDNLQQSSARQKALVEDWHQASQYWINRMQSEVALWGELLSKLATAQSGTEAFDIYAKCLAEQMKMSMEDGFRFLEDFQHLQKTSTRTSTKDGLTDRE